MFTSNTAQYLSEKNENLSPLTNIDTLYYERVYKEDSSYIIKRQNMAKHMPVGYVNTDISISQYSPIIYNSSTYQYETADGNNYVNVIGEVSKYETSLYLNNGSAGQPVDSPYTMYQIDIHGDVSLNDCIGNYQTKYDTNTSVNDLSSYIYTAILSNNTKYDASLGNISKTVKNINTKVNNIQYMYNNVSDNFKTRLLPALSEYNSIHTESINIKDNSDPFNSYIYTHEALWQLMSNNKLIPGNTYNMLYYPRYDVSIIENTYLEKYIITEDKKSIVMAKIKANPIKIVNTLTETYSSLPAVMKLTAVSPCQFSQNVMMTDFKNQIDNYFTILKNNNNHIGKYILNQPYNNVFQYVSSNKIRKMSPVLLDIIMTENSTNGIIVLYDHYYGYMFCPVLDLSQAFNSSTFNQGIFVFQSNNRYENNNIALQDIYNYIIFKNINGKRTIQNCELPNDIYKNVLSIINTFLTDVSSIEKIPAPLSQLSKIWTINNVQYYYYDNKYDYLYDAIDYSKWCIKYNFNDNRIIYLQDEYGNEAPYDFRNKIILHTDTQNNILAGFTYNIASMSKFLTSINVSILDISQNAPYDALLYQGVCIKNKLDGWIYNNRIDSNTMFMTNTSGGKIVNNIITNTKGAIIYDSMYCSINGGSNICLLYSKNIDNNYTSNILSYNNSYVNLKNVNINTPLNFTYPNTYTIIFNNIRQKYINDSSVLNIYNCKAADININNCNMINIQNNNLNTSIYMHQLHNVTLHYDTYNMVKPLQSNIFVFNGSIFNSSCIKK